MDNAGHGAHERQFLEKHPIRTTLRTGKQAWSEGKKQFLIDCVLRAPAVSLVEVLAYLLT